MIDATQHDVIADAVDAGHAASHRGFVPTFEQLKDVLVIVEYALKDRYVTQQASDRLKVATVKQHLVCKYVQRLREEQTMMKTV